MVSSREFQTESIDLASFLAVAGHVPSVYRNPASNRAIFEFAETSSLHRAILDYERGASLPAKRLLNARSWLFREASRVMRGAGYEQ